MTNCDGLSLAFCLAYPTTSRHFDRFCVWDIKAKRKQTCTCEDLGDLPLKSVKRMRRSSEI